MTKFVEKKNKSGILIFAIIFLATCLLTPGFTKTSLASSTIPLPVRTIETATEIDYVARPSLSASFATEQQVTVGTFESYQGLAIDYYNPMSDAPGNYKAFLENGYTKLACYNISIPVNNYSGTSLAGTLTVPVPSGYESSSARIMIYNGTSYSTPTAASGSTSSSVSFPLTLTNGGFETCDAWEIIIEFKPVVLVTKYKVTFNANGGVSSQASKQVTKGATYGTLPTPSRTGYSFAGWYTAKTGGTKITASSSVKLTSNATLYARWTAKKCTATFNGNGGKIGTKSSYTKQVTYNGTYGTLSSPKRAGYTFSGWYTAKTGGSKITASSKVALTSNKTFYAHWSKVTVAGTSITKYKNESGKKTYLSYKKVSGAKGYEVQYSTDKKFKKSVKTKTLSKTSLTITKLKKKSTYYFRVRAYKMDSAGKKVYGKYSSVKKLTIKK